MVTIELKITSDNAHEAVNALGAATVDLEIRGFNKSRRLIVNKINGEFIFTQEFRRGIDDRAYSLQDVRDNGEPQKVRRPL